jgi:hypothetical protein
MTHLSLPANTIQPGSIHWEETKISLGVFHIRVWEIIDESKEVYLISNITIPKGLVSAIVLDRQLQSHLMWLCIHANEW